MKVTFTTNPKSFEKANYVFAQAIKSLRDNPVSRTNLNISIKDIEALEVFRMQMVKGFFKSNK